jgi:hypothetical protein
MRGIGHGKGVIWMPRYGAGVSRPLCVRLDSASSQYLLVGDKSNLSFEYTDKFSISAWVKPAAIGSDLAVVSKRPSGGIGWYFLLDSSGQPYMILDGGATGAEFRGSALTAGVWSHVCMVWDADGTGAASNGVIYINGVAGTTIVLDTLAATILNANDVSIGSESGGGSYFNGDLDDVAVFDSALTPAQVAAIYGGGVPGDVMPYEPIVVWRMGDDGAYPDIVGQIGDGARNDADASTVVPVDMPQSIDFDGTDDYILIGDVAEARLEYNVPWTVSAWVKTSSTSDDILAKNAGGAADRGWNLSLTSGGAFQIALNHDAGAGNAINKYTDSAYNDGSWHHVAVTYTGGGGHADLTIYVDKVAVASTGSGTITDTAVGTTPFTISSAIALLGRLQNAVILDYAATPAQVETLYLCRATDVAALNPVGWWKLGTGDTYPTATDSGTSSYSGTMLNMSSSNIVTDSPGGTFSTKAVTFDGVNETVDVGKVAHFDTTTPFTLSAWVYLTGSSTCAVMGKQTTGAPFGYALLAYPSGAGFYFDLHLINNSTVSGVRVETTDIYAKNTWHHVCVSWDGNASGAASGVTFRINGAAPTQNIHQDNLSSASFANPDGRFTIGDRGNYPTAPLPLTGKIDEVSVWTTELSTTEMDEIYNSGTPADLASHSAVANLLGWWRMGDGDTFPILTNHGSGSGYTSGGHDGTMTNMDAGDIVNDHPAAIEHWSGFVSGPGGVGLATPFDADTDQALLGDYSSLRLSETDAWSISAWVRITSTGRYRAILRRHGSSPGFTGWLFSVDAADKLVLGVVSDTATGDRLDVTGSAGTVTDGAWHHVVATYDGSKSSTGVMFYADTTADPITSGPDSVTGSIAVSGEIGRIGAFGFGGDMCHLALFDRVLSTADISTLYGGGTPPADISALRPIHHWPMGDGDNYPTLRDLGNPDLDATMTNMSFDDIVPRL